MHLSPTWTPSRMKPSPLTPVAPPPPPPPPPSPPPPPPPLPSLRPSTLTPLPRRLTDRRRSRTLEDLSRLDAGAKQKSPRSVSNTGWLSGVFRARKRSGGAVASYLDVAASTDEKEKTTTASKSESPTKTSSPAFEGSSGAANLDEEERRFYASHGMRIEDLSSRPRPHTIARSANLFPRLEITSDFFKDGLVRPRSPLKTTKSVSNMSANSSSLDDGTSPEGGKQRQKVEEWRKKIEILKREIDNEQRQKDANVNEFLQMSQKADKSQISILKNIFEKRNLSHSVKIQKAQTNIEKYLRKIEEAESNVGRSFFYSPATSLVGSPVKKVDRDSDAQSKLKTFVSDDNLSAASDANSGSGAADAEPASDVVTGGSYGGGGGSSVGGGGGSNSNSLGGRGKAEPQDFSFVNGATTTTTPGTSAQEAWLLNELCASVNRARSDVMEMREAHERQMQDMLRQQQKARKDLEELRLHYDDEMKSAEYRYQRLEDQLNDQIDLQHTELLNLKQELIVLAKKEEVQIVDYRSEERSRDLHEKLEACEHKVEKMEKNQQDIYMPNPDNLQGFVYPKLINVVLCLIQLAILLINTVYNLATPFILTKPRLIMTIILATTMMVLHWNYDLVAVLILRIFDSNHSLIKSFQ